MALTGAEAAGNCTLAPELHFAAAQRCRWGGPEASGRQSVRIPVGADRSTDLVTGVPSPFQVSLRRRREGPRWKMIAPWRVGAFVGWTGGALAPLACVWTSILRPE